MPSINLLPKNLVKKRLEEVSENRSGLPMLMSFLLLSVVLLAFAALYLENNSRIEKVNSVNTEIGKIDSELKKTVRDNYMLTLEGRARDVNSVINDQEYFTELFYFLQNKLMENVYAKSIKTKSVEKDDSLEMDMILSARDYLSISGQIQIFKNEKMVKSVELKMITKDNEGFIDFNIIVTVSKEMIQKKSLAQSEDASAGEASQ